jgi:hypothetical protein
MTQINKKYSFENSGDRFDSGAAAMVVEGC